MRNLVRKDRHYEQAKRLIAHEPSVVIQRDKSFRRNVIYNESRCSICCTGSLRSSAYALLLWMTILRVIP